MLYQIEITTHCNFECFYCAGRNMPQRNMEWDLFASIIGSIPPGPHVVSLQGEGEPTVHPRFWDMAETVRTRGLVPYTITNGSCAEPGKFAAAFPNVAVSIDTLDPVEAERIGRHKLNRVLENLDALTEQMGAKRILIMTVDYGQPLDKVRAFAATRILFSPCNRRTITRAAIRTCSVRRRANTPTAAAFSTRPSSATTTSAGANTPVASSRMRACTSRSRRCRRAWQRTRSHPRARAAAKSSSRRAYRSRASCRLFRYGMRNSSTPEFFSLQRQRLVNPRAAGGASELNEQLGMKFYFRTGTAVPPE